MTDFTKWHRSGMLKGTLGGVVLVGSLVLGESVTLRRPGTEMLGGVRTDSRTLDKSQRCSGMLRHTLEDLGTLGGMRVVSQPSDKTRGMLGKALSQALTTLGMQGRGKWKCVGNICLTRSSWRTMWSEMRGEALEGSEATAITRKSLTGGKMPPGALVWSLGLDSESLRLWELMGEWEMLEETGVLRGMLGGTLCGTPAELAILMGVGTDSRMLGVLGTQGRENRKATKTHAGGSEANQIINAGRIGDAAKDAGGDTMRNGGKGGGNGDTLVGGLSVNWHSHCFMDTGDGGGDDAGGATDGIGNACGNYAGLGDMERGLAELGHVFLYELAHLDKQSDELTSTVGYCCSAFRLSAEVASGVAKSREAPVTLRRGEIHGLKGTHWRVREY
ncbi:hypothetical protein EDB86DRAFT_2825704 [Lactarius hatsudake]|nr:hypothetical protein EDB86DRAFT_2825704 [Lactarius hatsudake]